MILQESQPPQPRVAILLLNYKAAEMTLQAVESLQHLNYPLDRYEIHVIDNASNDGSVELFQLTQFEITLHQNEENWGYAGGHNPILKKLLETRPDIDAFWLLNNDTTIAPNALQELVKMHQKYPRALIGSKVCYPDGRFQRVGSYLNFLKTKLVDYKEMSVSDGEKLASLTGASWLLPRQVLLDVGLLDERYFLYFEDNDTCFRARQKGWDCRVALNSVVYHAESATTAKQPALMTYYYQRNRLLFLQRFLSPWVFQWVLLYTQWRLKRKHADSAFKLALSDFKQGTRGRCSHKALYQ